MLLAIEQDGRLVSPENGRVSLRRAPFTLVLRVPPGPSILVNASERPETIEDMRWSDDFDDLPGFHHTGMAEGDGNPGRELWLSRDRSHSWYAEDGHCRFDAPPEGGVGRRTVSRVVFLDDGRKGVDMAAYPYAALHLALAQNAEFQTRRTPVPGLEVYAGLLRVATRKESLSIDFRP